MRLHLRDCRQRAVHARRRRYAGSDAGCSTGRRRCRDDPDLKNVSNFVDYQLGLVFKPMRAMSVHASYGTSNWAPARSAVLTLNYRL